MNANDTRIIHKLPKRMYLEYIKLFPVTRTAEIKTYTTLILTLIAIIGFSLFAISPTINTILELRRTLADSEFANEALEDKIAAMQSLQQQHGTLNESLTRIGEAIPVHPEVPTLFAKIQTLANTSGIRITKFESQEVALTKKGSRKAKPSSFVYLMTTTGSYPETMAFLEAFQAFDRITTIDSLQISRENKNGGVTATIRAKAYFHPEAL